MAEVARLWKIEGLPNSDEFSYGDHGYWKRTAMATAHDAIEIEYPESDGRPMGETDLHRDWMFRILEILRYRYREQKVYVASDLLVYYQEGQPSKFVVPDVFIAFDCKNTQRRTYKIWEEGQPPDVVFEVTSRSTSREDSVFKLQLYRQIGVRELFVYDPSAEYLEPSLQGYRLDDDGHYSPIRRGAGTLRSQMLGVDLDLNDLQLVLTDAATGKPCLPAADAEREWRIAEQEARIAATQAREAERAARLAEADARQAEHEARLAEAEARRVEREARLAAEARVRELQAELDRLRGGG